MNHLFSQYDRSIENMDVVTSGQDTRFSHQSILDRNTERDHIEHERKKGFHRTMSPLHVSAQAPLGISVLNHEAFHTTGHQNSFSPVRSFMFMLLGGIVLSIKYAYTRGVSRLFKVLTIYAKQVVIRTGTKKIFLFSLLISTLLLLCAILIYWRTTPSTIINIADIHKPQELVVQDTYEISSKHVGAPSYAPNIQTSTIQVNAGMTLSDLAIEYDISLDTLITWNGIQDVRYVRAGDTLAIPNKNGVLHTVQNGESIHSIAEQYSIKRVAILDSNNLQTSTIHRGDTLFIPGAKLDPFVLGLALGTSFLTPVKGRLTSDYGYRISPITGKRHFHYGIDIANRTGTPIVAVANGYVAYTEKNNPSLGQVIILKHPQGFQSLYGHLSKIHVKRGDRITRGHVLGLVGNTGQSTGPHLHFTLIYNNKPVNPKKYLKF